MVLGYHILQSHTVPPKVLLFTLFTEVFNLHGAVLCVV